MAVLDNNVRERAAFLGQEPGRLREFRGQRLYDALNVLGLSHEQFFRAMGTNLDDYCAQEYGVDLRRITVERFFQSDPNAKWLFPDIVREAVVAGLKRKPAFPELIIRDEKITGNTYDVPYVTEDADEEELRTVSEGAAIPESQIAYGDRIVKLDKKGRGIIASYEAIRRMSVDALRVHLSRMGERLGRNLDARLASVLISGDASGSGTAAVVVNTAAQNVWTYADIVRGFVRLTLDHYFTPTHMIANAALETILNLDEFQDAALFDFAKSGNLPTPLGVKLVPMVDQPANRLTILDSAYAVAKLTEQDLLVESDKLINQQWDRTYITVVTDFAVIYDRARVVVRSDW